MGFDGVRSPQFCFNVSARNPCFSDPTTRVNGERFSYLVPTYDGLRGICDSVMWKPTIKWVVSRVRVLNEIQMETKSMLYPKFIADCRSRTFRDTQPGGKPPEEFEGGDRGYCTYLKDVSYNVECYFVWNDAREDLSKDRNMAKYITMMNHAIEKGGRLDVFMGKREGNCYGDVRPAKFMDGEGFYDNVPSLPLGPMFHGFSYPEDNGGVLSARFWIPSMNNGIIEFPSPIECPKKMTRDIKKTTFKRHYELGVNTSGCEEGDE